MTDSEKRGGGRQRVLLSGTIVFGAHSQVCSIINRSENGARLRLLTRQPLPSIFYLIDVEKGRAHEAEMVWLKRPLAGVAFKTSLDLSGPLEPEHKHLERLWKQSRCNKLAP